MEVCRSAAFARVVDSVPTTLSPSTGSPIRMPWKDAAFECGGGAFHTALNLLTDAELADAADAKTVDLRSFLCAQIWPLPRGYSGPLNGSSCEWETITGPGLQEAEGRLELVRRGGCVRSS